MHSILRVWKIEDEDLGEYKTGKIRTYDQGVTLADPTLLDVHLELEPVFTNHIQSLFPSMVLQQIHNTLAVRQIVPKGVDAFELVFHFFGYVDDTPDVRAMRIKQANLVGPAGYISMEDGEATQLVQQGIVGASGEHAYDALGGRGVISVVSNQIPAEMTALARNAHRQFQEIIKLNPALPDQATTASSSVSACRRHSRVSLAAASSRSSSSLSSSVS